MGYLKGSVYSPPINHVDEFLDVQVFRTKPEIFEEIRNSMLRRYKTFVEVAGGFVEQLL